MMRRTSEKFLASKFTLCACLLLHALPKPATAAPLSARIIDDLQSGDDNRVAAALDQLTPSCAPACTPFIADALQSPSPATVKAAARAAQKIADPALSPALTRIMHTHPDDEARMEALNALIHNATPNDYRALFLSITPNSPNALQKKILRHMPPSFINENFNAILRLATNPQLTTSIAAAFNASPDRFLNATLQYIEKNPSQAVPLLRLLSLMKNDLKKIRHSSWISAFNHPSDENIQNIAPVLANIDNADSTLWLLAYADRFTPQTLYAVLENIHGNAALNFSETILNTITDAPKNHWTNAILRSPNIHALWLLSLKNSTDPKLKSYALNLIDTPNIPTNLSRAAIIALSAFSAHHDVQTKLLQFLAGNDQSLANAALHTASHAIQSWDLATGILRAGTTSAQTAGSVWYAQWILVSIAKRHFDRLTTQQIQSALRNAESILNTPQNIHAEPALYLFNLCRKPAPFPALQTWNGLRPDMQRLYVNNLSNFGELPNDIMPYLQSALQSHDPVLPAATLQWITDNEKKFPQTAWIDNAVENALHSNGTAAKLQAARACAVRQSQTCIPALNDLLGHTDPAIVYNALLALQMLHALPNQQTLRALYRQTGQKILKNKLASLLGLPTTPTSPPPLDFNTQSGIPKNTILQLQIRNLPVPASTITILQTDGFLKITRTNLLGLYDVQMY